MELPCIICRKSILPITEGSDIAFSCKTIETNRLHYHRWYLDNLAKNEYQSLIYFPDYVISWCNWGFNEHKISVSVFSNGIFCKNFSIPGTEKIFETLTTTEAVQNLLILQ